MKYAIISDIHSNLESFKFFLKILSKIQIEKIICLGDIVGYNANPNECIQIISSFKNLDPIEIINISDKDFRSLEFEYSIGDSVTRCKEVIEKVKSITKIKHGIKMQYIFELEIPVLNKVLGIFIRLKQKIKIF